MTGGGWMENYGLDVEEETERRLCVHCGRWVVDGDWAGYTLLAVEDWPVECAVAANRHHEVRVS